MWATPCDTCLRSFFLKTFFLPLCSGGGRCSCGLLCHKCFAFSSWLLAFSLGPKAEGQELTFMSSLLPSSSVRSFPCAGPCGYVHWCGYVVRGPADYGGGGSHGKSRSR